MYSRLERQWMGDLVFLYCQRSGIARETFLIFVVPSGRDRFLEFCSLPAWLCAFISYFFPYPSFFFLWCISFQVCQEEWQEKSDEKEGWKKKKSRKAIWDEIEADGEKKERKLEACRLLSCSVRPLSPFLYLTISALLRRNSLHTCGLSFFIVNSMW